MAFLFAEKSDANLLRQGDLLVKNNELKAAIAQSHEHYAKAEDYTHFLVLTQSCDLVRYQSVPKARYIVVAAVRPLRLMTDRFFSKYSDSGFDLPIMVCNKKKETDARRFLERLLHNEEIGYFFVRRDGLSTLPYDVCAFLSLSIALGVEHYNACLQAKIAQLEDIFSAKVGWLTGNQYSHIGTPDVEEKCTDPDAYKETFYREVLYDRSAWLTTRQRALFKKQVREWEKANGKKPDLAAIKSMLDALPDSVTMVARRVLDLLSKENHISGDPKIQEAARNLLINDDSLKSIINSAEQTD